MEHRTPLDRFRTMLETIEGTDACIRIRTHSDQWFRSCNVLLVSDNAMVLQDSNEQRHIIALRNIAEFEIDKPTLGFQKDTVYAVGE